MIIEFFGVPGGGKTQLLRELVASTPNSLEAIAVTRSRIAIGATRFAFRHPISFLVWIMELILHSNGLLRYKCGLLLRSMAARSIAESSPSKITFVDEGLFQRMLTIFDAPLSTRHLRFLMCFTPFPSLIIVMHGGMFSRFTVASNRMNSPRVKYGEKKLNAWMENVRKNAENISKAFPKGVVVSLEGPYDPSSVIARSIFGTVQTILNSKL